MVSIYGRCRCEKSTRLYGFSTEEEDNQNNEDKRKNRAQRADTCQNPKRHIPPVSLLLC